MLLLALMLCATAEARLLLVTSQDTVLYEEFMAGLTQSLEQPLRQTLEIRLAAELPAATELPVYDLIVASGVDAAKALAARGLLKQPVLYTMLPLASYQWLAQNRMLAPQHKLFQIDQPPARYIRLASAALPGLKAAGFLHGQSSVLYVDEMEEAAQGAGLTFAAGDVAGAARLATLLKEIFARSDAVLLLPDPFLYNRRTVQEVLLASFRYRRPLVAYSEPLLKAGAWVALFSTPQQIGRQTAEMLACAGQPCYDAIPQRAYPKYFTVLVNDAVARQFGISGRSSEELQRYLESIEAARAR